MYDRFGEFDSAEEINKKAAEMIEAGDIEGIYALAAENGIEKEDAAEYLNGRENELTSPLMAAFGKLKVESEHLKISGELSVWMDIVKGICMEDMRMCEAVRKKGKSMKICMAALIKYSFENKVQVSDQIVDEVKVEQVNDGKIVPMRKPLYMSGMDRVQARRIITDYYTK